MKARTAMLVLGAVLAMGMTSPVWAQNAGPYLYQDQDPNIRNPDGGPQPSVSPTSAPRVTHERRQAPSEAYRARAQAPATAPFNPTPTSPYLYQDQDPDTRNPN